MSELKFDRGERCFPLDIPSAITTLCRNIVANVWSTRYMERLGWRSRKRLSSRQCVKQAMDGLFVAKQQLYRVLKSN